MLQLNFKSKAPAMTKVKKEVNKKRKKEKTKKVDTKQAKPSTPKEKVPLRAKVIELRQDLKKRMDEQQEISKLTEKWKEIMAEKDIFNNMYQTFTLAHIKIEPQFGFSARIYAPYGLALKDIEKLKDVIESGLACIFSFEVPSHNEFAMCKIIFENKVKVNEIPFNPPKKLKPNELYAGVDVSGEPVIFDVNATPHVLIAGDTRSGKNGCLDHIITSLIYNCSEKDIELYLYQGAKNDLTKYKNCKQARCFIMGDYEQFLRVLKHVKKDMEHRSELMLPMVEKMQGDNIMHYNKKNPSNKLSYKYIVMDEFMSIIPKNTDSKAIKGIKHGILEILEDIARFGGALGVNYIIAHQKPEKELCPTFLKNMSTIRICFSFGDLVCSEIVLGNNMAVNLPPRRAYFKTRGKCDLLFTTDLTDRIAQFITPSYEVGHRTVFDVINILEKEEADTLEKEKSETIEKNKKKGKKAKEKPDYDDIEEDCDDTFEETITQSEKKEKTPSSPVPPTTGRMSLEDFSKVRKTAQEILAENIAKIPNFVPYTPLTPNVKVVDKKLEGVFNADKSTK